MPHQTKIATCCYCGTRAALVLRGRERHELSCAACGAPLHDMKMLRTEATRDHPIERAPERKPRKPRGVTPLASWERELRSGVTSGLKRRKKKKRKKSLASKLLSEAFDVIEDIFD